MQRLRFVIIACLACTLFVSVALAQGVLDQCNDPSATVTCVYMPLMMQARPSATATPAVPTATPLPPSFNNCRDDPNAAQAPNAPVYIAAIDKSAETVTLRNSSANVIDLTGWRMCSITGNQQHPIGGNIGPGQTRTFAGPAAPIWNNDAQDDGALYDPQGRLISYLVCIDVRCP